MNCSISTGFTKKLTRGVQLIAPLIAVRINTRERDSLTAEVGSGMRSGLLF